MERLEQIVETYGWYQGVGNEVVEDRLARVVRNLEQPDIWVANHLSRVRARSPSEIGQLLERAERAFAHCAHRMVIVDPLTPAALVARLSQEGYTELTPTLQMVLEGPLAPPGSKRSRAASGAAVEIRPVTREADWDALYPLVRENHIEGSSSHHIELDEAVTRQIVAGYRSKSQVAQFFLASVEQRPCAYGAAIVGPHGMGIVEDLFTSRSSRLGGLATRIIEHAVAYARGRGMGPMLIGPHVTETPKIFYAALGFVPQCVTRQYILDLDASPGG